MGRTLRGRPEGEGTVGLVRLAPLLIALVLLGAFAPAGVADAAERRTVPGELKRLRDEGRIDHVQHDSWRTIYDESKRTWRKLKGKRRRELQGVLHTTERLAARRRLTSTRAPLVFLTLERNRAWWAKEPLLSYGRRVSFRGSLLVWQMYPGQGIQVQWLATFGKANGFFLSGRHDDQLRMLLDEALPLAVPRAGGLGFEYMFTFDGGAPPWVSAIAQGTAVQAFSRAAARLRDPRYFEAARAATAPLRAAPPSGVRASDGHLLMYSFAPRLRILNGFAQALVGLFDFAKFANDDAGRAQFADGDARLRRELAAYDTGAWSLYRPGVEASLGYHRLQRDFLRNLCKRLTAAGAPDPAPYCETADRFTTYMKSSPVVRIVSRRLRAKRSGKVRIDLDKRSTVALTLRREGKVVLRRVATLSRGRRTFDVRPRNTKPLDVEVHAVDLAGNATRETKTLQILPSKRRKAD